MKTSQSLPGPQAGATNSNAPMGADPSAPTAKPAYGGVDVSPAIAPPAKPAYGGVDVSPAIAPAANFGSGMAQAGIGTFRKMLTDKIGYDPLEKYAADFGPVGQRIISDPVNNNPLSEALRQYRPQAMPRNVRPQNQSMGGWQSLMQRMSPR